ncbi:hypothetical protein [Streptomyces qinzhouensis]|uniref:Uncharacterized protein n=1 Tax=Streptomyces qinzhouensis TaxID=2599401 RepID=A0A5B8JDP2_9ACTN|nr:hypothetical protein [Streptomyces qinzhouensis]QDY75830.1 hypothetical protein FQU76_04045 [Streptomyces qinzhouensis]
MERPLLSLRATLILLLGVLAGLGAGVLAGAAGENTARSVLCGLAATALAVPFFDKLVGLEEQRSAGAPPLADGPADALPGPGGTGAAGVTGADGGDRRG